MMTLKKRREEGIEDLYNEMGLTPSVREAFTEIFENAIAEKTIQEGMQAAIATIFGDDPVLGNLVFAEETEMDWIEHTAAYIQHLEEMIAMVEADNAAMRQEEHERQLQTESEKFWQNHRSRPVRSERLTEALFDPDPANEGLFFGSEPEIHHGTPLVSAAARYLQQTVGEPEMTPAALLKETWEKTTKH